MVLVWSSLILASVVDYMVVLVWFSLILASSGLDGGPCMV